jgi:hypothetical protein
MKVPLEVPGLNFPVFLRGTIDRIDRIGGVLRILDYKTGYTKNTEVEINAWEDIVSNPDKSKAFQTMTYALMYHTEHPMEVFEAGIIPIRNLDKGIFRFCIKSPGTRLSQKDFSLNPETLEEFRNQLHRLLLNLCDIEIPFEAIEE